MLRYGYCGVFLQNLGFGETSGTLYGAHVMFLSAGGTSSVLRLRAHPRKQSGQFPELNSISHGLHGVKVVSQVVDAIKQLAKRLPGGEQVPQVSACVPLADHAFAARIGSAWRS
jgi:hypothetical protein